MPNWNRNTAEFLRLMARKELLTNIKTNTLKTILKAPIPKVSKDDTGEKGDVPKKARKMSEGKATNTETETPTTFDFEKNKEKYNSLLFMFELSLEKSILNGLERSVHTFISISITGLISNYCKFNKAFFIEKALDDISPEHLSTSNIQMINRLCEKLERPSNKIKEERVCTIAINSIMAIKIKAIKKCSESKVANNNNEPKTNDATLKLLESKITPSCIILSAMRK